MHFLFEIADVFCITGRGVILFPGVPYSFPLDVQAGASIVIERPDGSRIETTIMGFEWMRSKVPLAHAPFSVARHIGKGELPPGARVFLAADTTIGPDSAKPPRCEVCSSPAVAHLAYGLPDTETMRRVDSGHAILAGCDVSETAARWHCTSCKAEWGVTEWAPLIKNTADKARADRTARHAEALSRGVLRASIDSGGLVRCPHCRRSFDVRSSMSWDGERHQSCGTYLVLSPKPPR